ncbi:MAG: M48 family metallopeptidase [Rhodospirillales bacterium]|nr:M48 family metallopeptidase [Alphaproteobacteria bacterium]MCB9987501.1 M48 family metallopeptidase [Rhodospirillales bacterium]USO07525.1 MAG: M48 family metallopeptidase [Rhodospirillales bacterium]
MFFRSTTPKPPHIPPEGLENVRVVRSGTARRVALRVDPARGEICLVVPKRASEKTAWRFADANREWIDAHLAKLEKPVPLAHGSVLPVFGRDRLIVVTLGTGRVTHCTLNDTTLAVSTPRPDPASNIRRYLYRILETRLRPLAETKSQRIERSVQGIQLRDTRARWGSCSPDGRLMFCWRLVFTPDHVIDYVVAHECAHLRYMNHSQRFWDLCQSLCEDMDGARAWLSANGDRLLCYGSPS